MENLTIETGIGRRIRELRKAKGLLQKQLAASAGMEVPQLWSIENDRNSPSIRTVARIASALSVTTADLLRESIPAGAETAASRRTATRLRTGLFDELPIMRPTERDGQLPDKDAARIAKAIVSAASAEAKQQTDVPTSLPLAFPVVLTEGGAEQLAHFLRAHLDIGSAIVRDVFALFENHGVRILEDAALTDSLPAVTFYSPRRKDFTVVLTKTLDDKPWRKEFVFLTEIGRIFVFASKQFETFTSSGRSRRFAHHFAATFLMPAAAVRTAVYSLRVKPGDWTYELLLRLKDRFRVSAEAFNIRLKELSLITGAKSAEFDKRIKEYYAQTNKAEPMPDKTLPRNRRGDLQALCSVMPLTPSPRQKARDASSSIRNAPRSKSGRRR